MVQKPNKKHQNKASSSTRTDALESAYHNDYGDSPCFIHARQLSDNIKANLKTLGIHFAFKFGHREKPGYKYTFK